MKNTFAFNGSALLTALILSVAASGCTYESFDTASDLDAVITVKTIDTAYDYSANRTWTMPEEVLDLSQYVDDSVSVSHKYDAAILEAIRQNMSALGYEFVEWPLTGDTDSDTDTGDTDTDDDTDTGTTADEPDVSEGLPDELKDLDVDLIVIPGIVATENWAYYGYYYPYYYYGYSWYAYYPGTVVAVSYDAGTVLISMIDKSYIVEDQEGQTVEVPIVWSAGLIGLLESVNATKIANGIDQAFEQSPYLDVNSAGGGAQ